MSYTTEAIIRVAQAAGGPIIIGDGFTTAAVIEIVQCTSAPVTVKAGNRNVEALVQIVQSGGKRVTIDFS